MREKSPSDGREWDSGRRFLRWHRRLLQRFHRCFPAVLRAAADTGTGKAGLRTRGTRTETRRKTTRSCKIQRFGIGKSRTEQAGFKAGKKTRRKSAKQTIRHNRYTSFVLYSLLCICSKIRATKYKIPALQKSI